MSRIRTIFLESIDSTNNHARRLLESEGADEPFVVVARTQSAGRGQFSRSWCSPVGALLCTLVYPGEAIAPDALGLRIGLACARTVEGVLRRGGNADDVRLKWPNDVYVGGKKILGVLTESVAVRERRYLLIGVGINANFHAAELPAEIATKATTLLDRLGSPTDLGQLLSDLVASIERMLRIGGLDGVVLAEARFRLHGIGSKTEIRTSNGVERGILLGLDDAGRPVVRTERGDVVGIG